MLSITIYPMISITIGGSLHNYAMPGGCWRQWPKELGNLSRLCGRAGVQRPWAGDNSMEFEILVCYWYVTWVLDFEIVNVRNRLTLTISKLTIINLSLTILKRAFSWRSWWCMRVFTFQETFQIEITKSYGMNAGCSGALFVTRSWIFVSWEENLPNFWGRTWEETWFKSIQTYSNPFKSTKIASWLLLSHLLRRDIKDWHEDIKRLLIRCGGQAKEARIRETRAALLTMQTVTGMKPATKGS